MLPPPDARKKSLLPVMVLVPLPKAIWLVEMLPPIPPPEPLDAAVIRPWASTVMSALVYDPGVTAVSARSMVPETVMVPPSRPVPAVMLWTVPLPPPPPAAVSVAVPLPLSVSMRLGTETIRSLTLAMSGEPSDSRILMESPSGDLPEKNSAMPPYRVACYLMVLKRPGIRPERPRWNQPRRCVGCRSRR